MSLINEDCKMRLLGGKAMVASVEVKKARKLMLVLLFLGWALGNLDRYLINYAIVFIGEDLSLTSTQTGVILSSFFLGYAIMQIPSGLLADKYGAKRVLIAAVILWSIFTGLTAVAWSLAAMVVIRFLFGIGEGGFQPSAAKIIATTFPRNERGKAMSILLSTGAIMGTLVPIISAILLVTIGWRMFFVIAGALGIIIAILYWKFIKVPDSVVDEEEETEAVVQEAKVTDPTQNKGILKKLFKMPVMWSLIFAFFTIYAVNWGLNSWLPTYLTNVRGLDMMSIGWMQLIPGVIMIIAMWVFGFVIDKISLKTGKQLGALAALLLAVTIFFMFQASTMLVFMTFQTIMSILMTYLVVLLPTLVLNVIPTQVAGTAIGIANTGAQFAGFVAPMAIGYMIDLSDGSYNTTVWMLIGLCTLCVVSLVTANTNPKKATRGEKEYETV